MPYESTDKMVHHPAHYQSTGMEVIDVIEAFTANLTGIEAFDTANVIKYICRWKRKNGVQDLENARWYLEHLIEHIKSSNIQLAKLYAPAQTETEKDVDIYMNTVCGRCPNVIEQAWDSWTLRNCEAVCPRYCSCDNVAIANDILRKKGD